MGQLDENFFLYMKTLSPAAVDLELRSLADAPANRSYFAAFLDALAARLRTHRDFEAVQTFLAVFLRLHGASVVEDNAADDADELQGALARIIENQRTESERVLELVSSSLGTLSFVRDVS
jgi:U3 small nucleolar RNA-associated protein 21